MARYAKHRRVYFIEEPVFGMVDSAMLVLRTSQEGVQVAVPHFPEKTPSEAIHPILTSLIDGFLEEQSIVDYALWYYTPMALPFSRHLTPETVIYDCMDELSLFKNAPPELMELEKELLRQADVVFTGGHSLYEAKKSQHHNIHPMPSSIDFKHFSSARFVTSEPFDQMDIPHPRLGFFGVVDERFDTALLQEMATLKPDWSFVIVGPVVKISPESLPKLPNIYYLGKKSYDELPVYLAGWDCALMPFALNESTRFISPTKTPEYLAAGKPVVSSAIRDVIRPYGEQKLVHIASTAEEFIQRADFAMKNAGNREWLERVENFLSLTSWDHTWKKMADIEIQSQDRDLYLQNKVETKETNLGVYL
jgi:UDP-galactopyranose mutase